MGSAVVGLEKRRPLRTWPCKVSGSSQGGEARQASGDRPEGSLSFIVALSRPKPPRVDHVRSSIIFSRIIYLSIRFIDLQHVSRAGAKGEGGRMSSRFPAEHGAGPGLELTTLPSPPEPKSRRGFANCTPRLPSFTVPLPSHSAPTREHLQGVQLQGGRRWGSPWGRLGTGHWPEAPCDKEASHRGPARLPRSLACPTSTTARGLPGTPSPRWPDGASTVWDKIRAVAHCHRPVEISERRLARE